MGMLDGHAIRACYVAKAAHEAAAAEAAEEERREEAVLWREAFSDDYRCNIASTQMHLHKDTCFKYVIDKGVRKAKHCRFHFDHFVTLMATHHPLSNAESRECRCNCSSVETRVASAKK